MCVGEADLTVGPLIQALARGERPADLPGVLSRFDRADSRFIPAPMVHDLDQIEFPKYEWCDLQLYRNYNDYQLTPIIASRGCRWSRCTFCAERFYWRIRSPENFVDELEWLVEHGCYLYMFNESDLNGMPERVMDICDEIVRRGLHRKVKLTGQLRIHKKSDRAFFEKLREANFVALRFGVDAFSANTLKLQKKGYTVDMASQNLKDCWESGIYTEVNWVIGVPGETDADVDEGIELILKNRQYIGRLANINPLILVNGGVYWLDPAAHNIKFRAPKDELYAKYPRAIPADYWYSVEPYIDARVRKERFEKIVLALHDAGFPVGAWAAKIIEDVKLARDPNRAGGAKADAALPPDLVDRRETKLAATPPLYRTAGEPPRLVRRLEHHDIVFFNGWYYGVPAYAVHGDVLNTDPSQLSGTIKHTTEEGVLAEIEKASEFANSRGRYDAQSSQKSGGAYMRADSAIGESIQSQLPDQSKVLRYKHGEFIAVAQERLEKAFDTNPFGWFERASDAPRIDERSPLRKVAARLPRAMQQELRRLARSQIFQEGESSGKLIMRSDQQMLGLLCRGALNAYVRQPANRLLRNGYELISGVQNPGVEVKGEEFSILSVVTLNAVPELMWSLDGYNVVKYDGLFYGLPHGHAVDWEQDDVMVMPNVITARTVNEVVAQIETRSQAVRGPKPDPAESQRAMGPANESSHVPILLATLDGYNIVTYEGWVYGIPHSLGPLDLTEVDLIGMPGVIRDVSRDVVENEVLERIKVAESARICVSQPKAVSCETPS
ncbi:MAG: B12-binding domain-containing radical SAM protein [Deltaproteobacteria bacterium]|nr:B12-binding domain-containing radical SAM protein [Deltaproteobacteria bacterium]